MVLYPLYPHDIPSIDGKSNSIHGGSQFPTEKCGSDGEKDDYSHNPWEGIPISMIGYKPHECLHNCHPHI